MKQITLKSLDQVKQHILNGGATLYTGAKTSTVIPFEKMESLSELDLTVADTSTLAQNLVMEGELLHVSGPVSWKEAKAFVHSHGRDIMTSPTEELAAICAGVATSCTGERCFGYGTLRSQVVKLKYLNYQAQECELVADRSLIASEELKAYQAAYSPYMSFKNAPFPRFEVETDLMTGTEGQLGFVTEVWLKTTELEPLTYLFLKLPCWDRDDGAHLEIFHKVQSMRHLISACELLDAHCLKCLPPESLPSGCENHDLVFLEIKDRDFEQVYDELLSKLSSVSEEDMFQMTSNACHALRMQVPRAVFERNSRMGVTKKGTDVQVGVNEFAQLLEQYRRMSALGVEYNLFGHFGDAHLHFNFMPTKEKEALCLESLQELYAKVYEWKGSPFAEHGIGFLKRPFIERFYSDTQKKVFVQLKTQHDPHNHFFPQGFMGPC